MNGGLAIRSPSRPAWPTGRNPGTEVIRGQWVNMPPTFCHPAVAAECLGTALANCLLIVQLG